MTFEQTMTAITVVGLQVANLVRSFRNSSQITDNHAEVMAKLDTSQDAGDSPHT